MTSLTKEQAQALFVDLAEPLCTTMLEAWKDWQNSPQRGEWRFPRGAAEFIWESWTAKFIPLAEEDPRVHVQTGHQTVHYVLNDEVLFRLKRADATGISANYPTMAALAFHDDEMPQLPLLAEYGRVEVIYKTDSFKTQVTDIGVVARDKGNVLWYFSLAEMAAAGAIADIGDAPTNDPQPRSLVAPKPVPDSRKSKDGRNDGEHE